MKRISVPETAAEVAEPALQGGDMFQIAVGVIVFAGVLFWLIRSLRSGAAVDGNGE